MSKKAARCVSVVMPVHNAEAYLERAMRSALDQSMEDLELVVVDDASTDGSRKIIGELAARDSRVVPLTLSGNVGTARARNCGLEVAQGKYAAFLDSDDTWGPTKLERQLEAMEKTGKSLCACAHWMHFDGASGQVEDKVFHVPACISYGDLLKTNYIACSTLVVKRCLVPKDLFDPSLMHEDYGAWLRLTCNGETVCGIDEPLATYLVRKGSRSSNKVLAARGRWQALRQCTDEPLPKRLRLFAAYAASGIRKYRL